jgi:hypothetical protein
VPIASPSEIVLHSVLTCGACPGGVIGAVDSKGILVAWQQTEFPLFALSAPVGRGGQTRERVCLRGYIMFLSLFVAHWFTGNTQTNLTLSS